MSARIVEWPPGADSPIVELRSSLGQAGEVESETAAILEMEGESFSSRLHSFGPLPAPFHSCSFVTIPTHPAPVFLQPQQDLNPLLTPGPSTPTFHRPPFHFLGIRCEAFEDDVLKCLPPTPWKILPEHEEGRADFRSESEQGLSCSFHSHIDSPHSPPRKIIMCRYICTEFPFPSISFICKSINHWASPPDTGCCPVLIIPFVIP